MQRLERTTLGTALLVVAALVLVAGLVGRIGDTITGTPGAPAPPPWMTRLAPGEQPPQFVLFSFDGAGDHQKWQRFLAAARESGAHLTGFLSGVYLLPDERRAEYTGPGHAAGRSSIGFGGTPDEVRVLVDDLRAAVAAGHEIGTHFNGHFCAGAEPAAGVWDTAGWDAELAQFFRFVDEAGLYLRVRGARTPCLEGRFDQLHPAMRAHGLGYDSSTVSGALAWPAETDGLWQFPLPLVTVPALGRRVIAMDYNFWYSLNKARDEPARAAEFGQIVLDSYAAAFRAALAGNRAPLVIGNHFNRWSGDAFNPAVERFMRDICPRPDTECVTYSELIAWMRLQDPAVLGELRARPPVRP
ncbi:MAG TPA: polysaccharide deacetylase [Pseudonocardiaceae bacterium]